MHENENSGCEVVISGTHACGAAEKRRFEEVDLSTTLIAARHSLYPSKNDEKHQFVVEIG